ncbi:MAG: hypothetical protein AMXMBFR64_33120 [Myxococcales bacterium]
MISEPRERERERERESHATKIALTLLALFFSADALAETSSTGRDVWAAVGQPTLSPAQSGAVILTVPVKSVAATSTEMAVTVTSHRAISVGDGVASTKVVLPVQTCGPKCTPSPLQIVVPVEGSHVPDAPGWVIVELDIADATGRHDAARRRIHLREQGGALSVQTGDAFVEAQNLGTAEQPLFTAGGQRLAPPAELLHVHPLDNPAFSEADKAHIAELLAKAPPQPGVLTGALASERAGVEDSATDEAPASSGCQSTSRGSSTGAWLLFALAVGLVARGRRRRGAALPFFVRGRPPGATALGLILVLWVPQRAEAATCYVQGTIALWDSVNKGWRSFTGSRRDWCDQTDTSCAITDADCCFEALPRIKVNLHRGSRLLSDVILTTDGGPGGAFILWDTSCNTSADYFVSFRFERDGYPARQKLTSQYATEPYTVVYNSPLTLVYGQWLNLGQISMNPGGDEITWAGDLASIWYTSHLSFMAFEGQGTTRHRKTRGSANAYDLITTRYYWWPDDGNAGVANCASSVRIQDGYARNETMAHELGHILHFRTVGCSSERVGMVTPWKQAGGVPEGSWIEGFAGFAGTMLTFLDPTTTVPGDLTGPGLECIAIGHEYANDLSNRRNQVRGLWELIDTNTSGNNFEASVLSLEQILAVMDAWQGTNTTCSGQTTGVNRTFCEVYATETATFCSTVVDCGVPIVEGGVLKDWKCDLGLCWKGDVHGRNIRDLIYHIAQSTGQGEALYRNALTSSPCVLGDDDSYPFTGGYRND